MKFKYLAFSLALATCLSITALSSIAAEPYYVLNRQNL